jgi:hypothetical protein
MRRRSVALRSAATMILALLVGCGGGGGGGESSTIKGNLTSAPSASIRPQRPSWLARIGDDFIGVGRRVFAATVLGGVQVQASVVNGGKATDATDDQGDFLLPGAPTGNVTVVFSRGSCQGEVILPDVTRDAVLTLNDVSFDCSNAHPSKVSETFRGVIRNVPGSPNGNLNVCVASGGRARTRAVKLNNTEIQDANGVPSSFNALADGQLIEADGEREGLGTSSALDAVTVRILGAGNRDDCTGQGTPTPVASPTPSATPSVTATQTPTRTPTP